MHEWVFWLALDTHAYRGYDRDTRVPHSELTLRTLRDAQLRRGRLKGVP